MAITAQGEPIPLTEQGQPPSLALASLCLAAPCALHCVSLSLTLLTTAAHRQETVPCLLRDAHMAELGSAPGFVIISQYGRGGTGSTHKQITCLT